ncbi:hypothetical protein [Mogibacterium diversum]|uniref:hypothetical protein n=1 Tax=Mogibacterium diversum TaxID=114527 RepID=UPI0026F10A37|nr:hypothetical protein [Mogibacterium diversum]
MTKQQLLALWQGKSWDSSPAGIYFVSRKPGKDLHFSFSGYSEKDIKSIPDSIMKRLSVELTELDQEALRLIKENFPEENVEGITLTDVMFDKSGCYDAFALGYYVGESPAGELYLLVSFDEEFEANREVICEAY